MLTLANDQLTVALLDPAADLDRCGSRYCVGGYIYQITDARKGELLSGPQYPNPRPWVFDGQGAPDHFATVLGADVPVGGEVATIGVGRVRRTSDKEGFFARDNPEVSAFLPWAVEQSADQIVMRTSDTFRDWAYTLTRTVKLEGRTVYSRTAIENQGQAPLPVRWYAHPFFPLTPDRVYCRLSTPVTLPENPGYTLNDEGFICQRPDYPWEKGCFLALEYGRDGDSLTFTQRHPLIDDVIAVTDFMPDWLPIWSNAATFSFEPYFIRELAPGEAAAWSIDYLFGR
jgi:hypothetical protein